jgi:hypothetical protein
MYPFQVVSRHSGQDGGTISSIRHRLEGSSIMTTQTQQKPNWFAASRLGRFMASGAGRVARIVAGIALIAGGLLAVGGPAGIIMAAIGLVPLLAGTFDVCVFSALFGGPFSGAAIRAISRR